MRNKTQLNQLQLRQISKKFNVNQNLVKSLASWLTLTDLKAILSIKAADLTKTVRVNFLKTDRDAVINNLKSEGILAKPLEDIEEGIELISKNVSIGSTNTYLSGEIMPQGYGSMLAVQALDPQPGEVILDMAAAPGGKSCFIGERLLGEGLLISNDISHSRLRSLTLNITRHGIMNSIILNQDANKLSFNSLDKILLDAPCSGEGLLVSNLYCRKNYDFHNSLQMQRVQALLIRKAISMLKIGGECVYATCSLNPFENEYVLDEILSNVSLVNLTIPGENGLVDINPEFRNVRRLLPSKFHCDGFFIAKMRREI